MTLSWVGSRELAFSKTPENLIRLAHQVFSPMAFLGVGSRVLAPGTADAAKSLSCVQLFVTPWTVAYQAPPSMGFSRQEYWSGFPFPSPGDLPNPGIEPRSPALQADALLSDPQGSAIYLYVKSLYIF